MPLPDLFLLSDLLRHRVRCDQGLDHGPGVMAWMHPPVHHLLGWVSRPSALRNHRDVWRLDQCRGVDDQQVYVKGFPAETDQLTLDRLPTLLDADLLDRDGERLGQIADLAFVPKSGEILYYLVSRSDPRLPGSSRWRLSPERIVDQQPGRVSTALRNLDDLPQARASVRQDLVRRSRHWREQLQQLGDRAGERLEGWLEEPPWDSLDDSSRREPRDDSWPDSRPSTASDPREAWDDEDWSAPVEPRSDRSRSDRDEDPWV